MAWHQFATLRYRDSNKLGLPSLMIISLQTIKLLNSHLAADGLHPSSQFRIWATLSGRLFVAAAFALTHPGIFQIVSTRAYPATTSPALVRGIEVLRSKINAVASVGRLRITEARAIELFYATATGVILLMLRCPPNERDMALSEEAREATITALTGEAVTDVSTGTPGVASALLSRLPDIKCLSHGERLLLTELLDRIVVSGERTCVAHFPTEGPLK
jgi:hypothetical protein